VVPCICNTTTQQICVSFPVRGYWEMAMVLFLLIFLCQEKKEIYFRVYQTCSTIISPFLHVSLDYFSFRRCNVPVYSCCNIGRNHLFIFSGVVEFLAVSTTVFGLPKVDVALQESTSYATHTGTCPRSCMPP